MSSDHRPPTLPGDAGLELLLQLTREMRQLAAIGAWDQVAGLEARRSGLLEKDLPLQHQGAAQQAAANTLREILKINAQIMSVVADARREAGRALRSINQGRQASGAYQKVESGV